MKTFIGLVALILILANSNGGVGSVKPETQSVTITVTTVDDEADIVANDQCSLREAIISTNENADIGGCVASGVYASNRPDVIHVPAGTYTLTRDSFFSLQDQDWGDLDIYGSVIIKGEATTRIEANALFIEPLMFIGPKNDSDPIPNVHLENLEVSALAGAIKNAGHTTLHNVNFIGLNQKEAITSIAGTLTVMPVCATNPATTNTSMIVDSCHDFDTASITGTAAQ